MNESVRAAWRDFASHVLPPELPPDQVEARHDVFMSGAMAGISVMLRAMKLGDLESRQLGIQAVVNEVVDITREMNASVRAQQARRS